MEPLTIQERWDSHISGAIPYMSADRLRADLSRLGFSQIKPSLRWTNGSQVVRVHVAVAGELWIDLHLKSSTQQGLLTAWSLDRFPFIASGRDLHQLVLVEKWVGPLFSYVIEEIPS